MLLSERLRFAMKNQQQGLHIAESFIAELEALERRELNASLAVGRHCYECQDFNDPPFCDPDCFNWSLRFALDVKDVDIWGPAEDDIPVESSYEKAKALRG